MGRTGSALKHYADAGGGADGVIETDTPRLRLMGFIVRLVGYAAGLALAAWALAGVNFNGAVLGTTEQNAKVLPILGVALILALVNTLIRPLVKMFVFPLIILTMGLFVVVLNTAMLLLTDLIANEVGLNFQLTGFMSALLCSLIVTGTAFVVDLLLDNE